MSQLASSDITSRHPAPVGSARWGGIVPGSTDPASHNKSPDPGTVASHADIQCSSCGTLHDFELILDYKESPNAKLRSQALSAVSGATVGCTGCTTMLAIPFADPGEGREIAAFDPRDSAVSVHSLMEWCIGQAAKVTEVEKRYVSRQGKLIRQSDQGCSVPLWS
jgi:hypothetical protein